MQSTKQVCHAWRVGIAREEATTAADKFASAEAAAQSHMECARWALQESAAFSGHSCVVPISVNMGASLGDSDSATFAMQGNADTPTRKRPRDASFFDATTGAREQMEGVRDFTPAPLVGSCA